MTSVPPTTASYFSHLTAATTLASATCLLSMRGYGFATVCTAAALGGVYAWRASTVTQSLKDKQGIPEKVDQIVRAFRFATLGLGAVSLGYGCNSLVAGIRPFTTPRSTWSLLPSLQGAQYVAWSFAYALPLGITLLSYALKTLRHHATITAQLEAWSRQGTLSLVNRSLEWMHGKGYDVISRSQALRFVGINLKTETVTPDDLQYLSDQELVTVLKQQPNLSTAVFENYLPKIPIAIFYDTKNTPEELWQRFTTWIESKTYFQLTVIFETIPDQLGALLALLDDKICQRAATFLKENGEPHLVPPEENYFGHQVSHIGIETGISRLPLSVFFDKNTPEFSRARFIEWIKSKSRAELEVFFKKEKLSLFLPLLNDKTQQDLKDFLKHRLAWCAKPPVTDATLQTVDPDTILNRFLVGIRDRQFVRKLSLPKEELEKFHAWETGFLEKAKKYQEQLWNRKVQAEPSSASPEPDIASLLMQKGVDYATCEAVIEQCCLTPLGDPWKTLQIHLGMMGIRTPQQLYQHGILKVVPDDREAEERLNTPEKVITRLVEFLRTPSQPSADAPLPPSIEVRSTAKKIAGVAIFLFENILSLALEGVFLRNTSRNEQAFFTLMILPSLLQRHWKKEFKESANHSPSLRAFSQKHYESLLQINFWLSDTTLSGRFKRLWSSIRS
jgi:hypothetical protein